MSYIRIEERTPLRGDTRKTKMYNVIAVQSGEYLGNITFYPHWRKFVFGPCQGTIFDKNCLTEIVGFLDRLAEERKAHLKARKTLDSAEPQPLT